MHCVKSVRIQYYYGPYFPVFGLNTDQNNSEYGHFSRSDVDVVKDYFKNNVLYVCHATTAQMFATSPPLI